MPEPKPLKCDRCGCEQKPEDELWTWVTYSDRFIGAKQTCLAICPACAELLKKWLKGK